VDGEEGISRERIERLHAAVGDHGQSAEALEVEALGRPGGAVDVRGEVNEADGGQEPGEVFAEERGHTVLNRGRGIKAVPSRFQHMK
jgi:hypothetical protein